MFTLGVFSLSESTTLPARLSLLRFNHGNDQQLLLKNVPLSMLSQMPHAGTNPTINTENLINIKKKLQHRV